MRSASFSSCRWRVSQCLCDLFNAIIHQVCLDSKMYTQYSPQLVLKVAKVPWTGVMGTGCKIILELLHLIDSHFRGQEGQKRPENEFGQQLHADHKMISRNNEDSYLLCFFMLEITWQEKTRGRPVAPEETQLLKITARHIWNMSGHFWPKALSSWSRNQSIMSMST